MSINLISKVATYVTHKLSGTWKLVTVTILLALSFVGKAQVSITNAVPVTQNFDGIGNSATATLPSGFRISNTTDAFSSAGTATTEAAGTQGAGRVSNSAAGGLYNFANGPTGSSTDRAVGFLTSSSFSSPCYLLMQVTNNSAATITSLTIAFDYEKCRSGSRAFSMAFDTSRNGSTYGTAFSAGAQSYAADGNNNVVFDPPNSHFKDCYNYRIYHTGWC
ncbi:MAG: hypothetical protein H7257_01225 [Taibaiella sp.]|nr:hypothetical protein [Taibaiella sp.]